jgi:hypothetical protein
MRGCMCGLQLILSPIKLRSEIYAIINLTEIGVSHVVKPV